MKDPFKKLTELGPGHCHRPGECINRSKVLPSDLQDCFRVFPKS